MTISGYNINSGFDCKGPLKPWELLCEEWILSINRFCRVAQDHDDVPYWHGERANIGLLAGAAERCGWSALIESSDDKIDTQAQKWRGRLDLWLLSPASYAIEGKFAWLYLSDRNSQEAKDKLKEACDDIECLVPSLQQETCVGVVFFAPYTSAKFASGIEERIYESLLSIQSVEHHAMAWCFPTVTRNLDDEKGDLYPGIIMLARVPNRDQRC